MENTLTFLSQHRDGIFIAIAIMVAFLFLIQWSAWIFCWGRFRTNQSEENHEIKFYLTKMLATLFDEFRHLLALVIVLIFGLSLFSAFINTIGNVKEFGNSIQVVASSLGSLVAAIIGYYFGESAGMTKERRRPTSFSVETGEAIQEKYEGEDIDYVKLDDGHEESASSNSSKTNPEP